MRYLNIKTYIEVYRTAQYVNKLRDFVVIIDDFQAGRLEDGGKLRIEVTPGEHEIYLKIDWCRSNKIHFSLSENEHLKFKCGCPISGWNLLNPFIMPYYIFFNKNKYLYIKRTDIEH